MPPLDLQATRPAALAGLYVGIFLAGICPQPESAQPCRKDTLGCSRKSIRLLTFQSSSRTWCELHRLAFERLGGTTRLIVLDNLEEGVLHPDIYDPELNPLYRGFLKSDQGPLAARLHQDRLDSRSA